MDSFLPFFTPEQWPEILRLGQPLHFKKGQVLFYEGHKPYGIFVLTSGEIDLSSPGGKGGEEVIQLPEARVIGWNPLRRGLPYAATGTALTDCRTVFISKTLLEPWLNPKGREGQA